MSAQFVYVGLIGPRSTSVVVVVIIFDSWFLFSLKARS